MGRVFHKVKCRKSVGEMGHAGNDLYYYNLVYPTFFVLFCLKKIQWIFGISRKAVRKMIRNGHRRRRHRPYRLARVPVYEWQYLVSMASRVRLTLLAVGTLGMIKEEWVTGMVCPAE